MKRAEKAGAAALTAMLGKRVACINERPQGTSLNEPQLKALSSSDTISVKFTLSDRSQGCA